MPLIFPYPATNGQIYTDDNTVVWQYDGVKWNVVTGTTKRMFNGVKIGLSINYSLTSVLEPINWDVEYIDTDNYFNIGDPSKIYIGYTGYYNLNINVFTDNSGAGYNLVILKNGVTTVGTGFLNPNQASDYNETEYFQAGDYIQLLANETTNVGALSNASYLELSLYGFALGTATTPYNAFSGVKTELSVPFSVTSTPTPISWTGTLWDTNANALALTYWNAGDPGKITVQTNGFYQISTFLKTGLAGSTYTVILRKNGTTTISTSTLNPNQTAALDQIYELLAGDYLEIIVSESSGTGTMTTECFLDLIRMGV